jgi:GNAT superfamily N-acetyltransferase
MQEAIFLGKNMRLAENKDLEKILKIIKDASASLKADGVDQWQRGSPSKSMVENDIKNKKGYVFEEDSKLLAYAFLKTAYEEDYRMAEEKFIYKNALTIHRFCVDGDHRNENVATRFIEEIKSRALENSFSSLRIDTHHDNKKMRGLIRKMKFREVAIVFVDDNGILKERIAYELKL